MAVFKFSVMVLCVASLLLVVIHAEDENNTPAAALELTTESFDNEIENNNYFVMFFAPWCGHCKRLHPLWEQLAELMNVKDEEPKVVIAKVDCTQHQELCAKHEVTGYPTLRFFKLGEKESEKFRGTRDMPAITEFINLQLNGIEHGEGSDVSDEGHAATPSAAGTLIELTEENFAKYVSSGNHFVKFYAPWCTHCQRLAPTWETLAKVLAKERNTVSIAKIDCTQYRPICQDFDIKGYPTLLWIEDGKKIEKYSGARDEETLKAYVLKMLGTETKQAEADYKPDQKATEEANKNQVLQLSEEDFEKSISDGITFVTFYAPWCGHCQKLSPIWDQLAEKIHGSNNNGIKIAKVDCTTPDNKNLCVEQLVEGYPTVFAYKNGEKLGEYDGGRSLVELENYVKQFFGHDEL